MSLFVPNPITHSIFSPRPHPPPPPSTNAGTFITHFPAPPPRPQEHIKGALSPRWDSKQGEGPFQSQGFLPGPRPAWRKCEIRSGKIKHPHVEFGREQREPEGQGLRKEKDKDPPLPLTETHLKEIAVVQGPLFSSIRANPGPGPATHLRAEGKALGPRPIPISCASVRSSKPRDVETQSQTDGCILLNWTFNEKSPDSFVAEKKRITALEDVHTAEGVR